MRPCRMTSASGVTSSRTPTRRGRRSVGRLDTAFTWSPTASIWPKSPVSRVTPWKYTGSYRAIRSCGLSGCHTEDATEIVLGNMATAETTFHCVACHQFQADVTSEADLAEVREAMSPSAAQCDACHQTEEVQPEFPVLEDPHEGRCGWCHNPHEQELPELAQETCTASGCHSDFAEMTPFHGLDDPHAQDCRSCHSAHTWTAPTDCQACHTDLR